MLRTQEKTLIHGYMAETYGQWVKRIRESKGLKANVVAKRAHITKQYISNIENGTPHGQTGALPTPSLKIVRALATALDVPESESLRAAGYTSEDAGTDPRQSLLLSYFHELSDNERGDALALVETVYKRRERVRRVPSVSSPQGAQANDRSTKKAANGKKRR